MEPENPEEYDYYSSNGILYNVSLPDDIVHCIHEVYYSNRLTRHAKLAVSAEKARNYFISELLSKLTVEDSPEQTIRGVYYSRLKLYDTFEGESVSKLIKLIFTHKTNNTPTLKVEFNNAVLNLYYIEYDSKRRHYSYANSIELKFKLYPK